MATRTKAIVQMSISPELLQRMDDYLKPIGVSRSAYVSMLVARDLDDLESSTDGDYNPISE
ncbi:hypothetical protein [Bifidobacterium thermacidophilum]|uniref:Ribbon-helix-helix protein CopG domain-containing protein n=1 Tax=Bifidobacterium thermacidophilum subsp. thermacidophilum TaxID=79262 RepID=A0A087E1H5_9BIFI|nr:hypothetical protein [Bifidobacterium thermacidophilum]KFJ01626.1 hypothetical protein THER5_1520 [Bifidobacterium thermacidophilum subsp. thermacidophilum]